jgi:hypothetical protein
MTTEFNYYLVQFADHGESYVYYLIPENVYTDIRSDISTIYIKQADKVSYLQEKFFIKLRPYLIPTKIYGDLDVDFKDKKISRFITFNLQDIKGRMF